MVKVKIHALEKTYSGKKVLQSFSYNFMENKRYCIMGSSGCGKTTLLRIIAGIEPFDAGEVVLQKGTGDILRAAVVFQEDRLCESYSVAANLRIGNRHLTDSEIKEVLERAGLEGIAEEKVCVLSGGMKRRVAILRALLAQSSLLLMDEPFTGLDEENRSKMIALIKEKTKGRTLLAVTHEASDVTDLDAEVLCLQ